MLFLCEIVNNLFILSVLLTPLLTCLFFLPSISECVYMVLSHTRSHSIPLLFSALLCTFQL